MIVDTFLYAGERDLLDLRLRTLNDVVDEFIAVVCKRTHQGQPIDELPTIPGGWNITRYDFTPDMTDWPEGERGGVHSRLYQQIEKQHRDACRDAVLTITDDPEAVVMVSDVDEIPDPAVVEQLGTDLGAAMFQACPWWTMAQRFHSTALNLLHPQQPWFGTCVSRLEDLQPQAMRDARTTVDNLDPSCGVIERAGWHLSWMGTDEERGRKAQTFSHAEHRQWDHATGRREARHVNGERLIPCDFPGELDWPAPLLDGTFLIPEAWLS